MGNRNGMTRGTWIKFVVAWNEPLHWCPKIYSDGKKYFDWMDLARTPPPVVVGRWPPWVVPLDAADGWWYTVSCGSSYGIDVVAEAGDVSGDYTG